jgi:diadenylate cyclase
MSEFFENYFARISQYSIWVVLLELLLIGAVVYLVVEFLRGTRGARLIKGTALFLVIAYVVILLAGDTLRRVAFLYERVLVLAALAIIVVFQPELRRALIRLGEARLFRPQGNPLRPTVDAICRTAAYCSKNRIGALVAIERDVGLGGLIENGTILNANLTPELLNTIFWPGSMLHDMGVVVRNGKLSAAGVQFPLAEGEEEDISPELGARHRAALGLSQETDAVIVVVSEETGTISVAEKGRFVRNLTVEGLEALLMESLARQNIALPGLRGSRGSSGRKSSAAPSGASQQDAAADNGEGGGGTENGEGNEGGSEGGGKEREKEELIGLDR